MTRHASRSGPSIPDDSAPVSPAHRPTRWTVRTVRGLGMIFLGLAVALGLLSTLVAYRVTQDAARQARDSQAQAAAVERRLQALEEYVAGKGKQRDADAQRQNQQFNQFVCDVLDQLPPGEVLDRVRGEYGCGPGLPTKPAAATSSASAAPGNAASSAGRPVSTSPPLAASRSTEPGPTTTPTRSSPAATSSAPGPQPADGLLCTALPIIC